MRTHVITLTLTGILLSACQAQAQNTQVSAYPAPGTRSASPETAIAFRGLKPDQIGTVKVTGSRSGRHSGTLKAHADGNGASFVPKRPFRRNESVLVETGLHILRARDGDFRIRIANPSVVIRRPARPNTETVRPSPPRLFATRRDLHPPHVYLSKQHRSGTPGKVLLGAKPKGGAQLVGGVRAQSGVMIVDNSGKLQYFRPSSPGKAPFAVDVQRYKGQPVLTWWEGVSSAGSGDGDLVIMDDQYRIVKRVRHGNGIQFDQHEFVITPRNTALALSYYEVKQDLRSVGGHRNGTVVDGVVQEIDLETGLVIFEWHSLGEVPLKESLQDVPPGETNPFDYVHLNSAEFDTDGDILVSARRTNAIYKLDYETARVKWTMGGKNNEFRFGRGAHFYWQHDVRRRADGALTLFDNGASPPKRKRSRAIALRVDEAKKEVRLARALTHPDDLLAANQGGVQTLDNGHVMVGWGPQRTFSEYDPSGKLVWDLRLAIGYDSYRAMRRPWVGRPHTSPSVRALGRSSGQMHVYASWNGATEVASWEVLTGATETSMAPVRRAGRASFETRITVARDRFVSVRALDAGGRVIGTSRVARVR